MYFLVSSSFKTLDMSGCLEKVRCFEMVCTHLTYISSSSFISLLFIHSTNMQGTVFALKSLKFTRGGRIQVEWKKIQRIG